MSPLPGRFTDRWASSRGGLSYEDSVCWHLLLGCDSGVRAVVAGAQQRLARFGDMHMTPARWLHATVLLAGPAAAISRDAMGEMLARATAALAGTAPVTVTLGRPLQSGGHRTWPIAHKRAQAGSRRCAGGNARCDRNERQRRRHHLGVDAAPDGLLQHGRAARRARDCRAWQGNPRLRGHNRPHEPRRPKRPGAALGLVGRRDRAPWHKRRRGGSSSIARWAHNPVRAYWNCGFFLRPASRIRELTHGFQASGSVLVGKQELGEAVAQCANRETLEETGVTRRHASAHRIAIGIRQRGGTGDHAR
jgi:hypothetical protein